MVMWIVLGALVGVVIIFLVVASIRDRRKSKKIRIEKFEIEKRKSSAGKNVAEGLLEIFEKIKQMLKDFVPSVGEVKMSDIRDAARSDLKKLEKSIQYKDLSEKEKNIKEIFNKFKKTSPNTWEKNLKKETLELKSYISNWEKSQVKKIEDSKSKKKKGKNAKKSSK